MMPLDEIAPKLHAFVAYCTPAGHEPPRTGPVPPMAKHVAVDTPDYAVTVYFSAEAVLTESADDRLLLLLAGDVYAPKSATIGATLLDLYERRGLDFVADLNGAFCLLLVDRQAGVIAFATDRMNSCKLLASWNGDTLIVSNSIYLQPVRGARLDRTAIAEYLANSYIFNDRTPYEQVRMLDSGSIYQLQAGKFTPRRYWRYQFQTPSTASPEALSKELGDLVIEATRRRVPDDRPVYVALSGGYDSSSIAAVLSKVLDVKDVTCITYALGEPQEGSDEFVGAQAAAYCGYRHQIVPAFDGDVVQMLTLNAHLGGAMTRPADEVDAWVRLGRQVAGGPAPVLMTGDTIIVEPDWHFTNRDDLITAARMYDLSIMPWLEPFLGSSAYHGFSAAIRADIETAVQQVPPNDEPYNFRDMLRFDQIQTRITNTWREYYGGRFFRYAHPLFDNDLLDFVLRLPVDHRRQKGLYLKTVRAMFPDLYAAPRATFASYAGYWPAALVRQNDQIQALIREQSSPLDDVISPDILLALLTVDRPSLTRTNVRLKNILRPIYRLLRRANLHRTFLGRPTLYTPLVSADNFLKRALTLRIFLSQMANNTSEMS